MKPITERDQFNISEDWSEAIRGVYDRGWDEAREAFKATEAVELLCEEGVIYDAMLQSCLSDEFRAAISSPKKATSILLHHLQEWAEKADKEEE
jgi:hypothetical protein